MSWTKCVCACEHACLSLRVRWLAGRRLLAESIRVDTSVKSSSAAAANALGIIPKLQTLSPKPWRHQHQNIGPSCSQHFWYSQTTRPRAHPPTHHHTLRHTFGEKGARQKL
jgi:hypothetical protein